MSVSFDNQWFCFICHTVCRFGVWKTLRRSTLQDCKSSGKGKNFGLLVLSQSFFSLAAALGRSVSCVRYGVVQIAIDQVDCGDGVCRGGTVCDLYLYDQG